MLDGSGVVRLVFRAADEPSPTPMTDVMVRVRNDAAVGLERVRVTFPDGSDADYGSLPPGRSSDYRPVVQAYGYSLVRVQPAGGSELTFQPIDFVGETPLPGGRYTYVLSIDGTALDLRLEVDR